MIRDFLLVVAQRTTLTEWVLELNQIITSMTAVNISTFLDNEDCLQSPSSLSPNRDPEEEAARFLPMTEGRCLRQESQPVDLCRLPAPCPAYLPTYFTKSESRDLPCKGWRRDPDSQISSATTLQVNSTSTLKVNNHSNNVGIGETTSTLNEPLPRYRHSWMNILRWEWLSVYRRLNVCVVIINFSILLVFAAQGKLLEFDPGDMSIGLAANITTAVLFRQEYVVNLLFMLFSCCPPSWPLRIRSLAAKIYHFGGVHSGAGVSSVIWLAFVDTSLGLQYSRNGLHSGRDVAVVFATAFLNLLLIIAVLTAHPKFRDRHHNLWELIHRFGGWTAVALFWVNFGLLADADRQKHRPSETVFEMLITAPVFWMLLVITVCLIAPWLRLRKVRVLAELQSRHAVRLHFTYTNLPLCAAPRLSTSPLMEWHSFAGIPEEDGVGFSVLVSSAGDWTKRMIADPPKKIWVRGIPVRGVLHVAPMFRKIILVATGSGIGPVMSLLYARRVDCRILWITRNPRETYQSNVIEQVLDADPSAEIVERVKGQKAPEMGSLAYQMYRESGAEAVFIISNRKGCYEGRMWLESRGVPVFTPIFDS